MTTESIWIWDPETLKIMFEHRLVSSIYGKLSVIKNSGKRKIFKLGRDESGNVTCTEFSRASQKRKYNPIKDQSKEDLKIHDNSIKSEENNQENEIFVTLPVKLLAIEAYLGLTNGWICLEASGLQTYIAKISNIKLDGGFLEIYPKTDFEKQSVIVYQYFWSLGWTLTLGSNFGCHFLAYCLTPGIVHSTYMIIIVPPEVDHDSTSIASIAALGVKVRKHVLLAAVSSNSNTVMITQISGCLFRRSDFGEALKPDKPALLLSSEFGTENLVSI